jgi:hypothetical protein
VLRVKQFEPDNDLHDTPAQIMSNASFLPADHICWMPPAKVCSPPVMDAPDPVQA